MPRRAKKKSKGRNRSEGKNKKIRTRKMVDTEESHAA
jgi:hypothetical protein